MRNWKETIDLQKARGFTLIELMVVIVIVGILTSVAYPSYLQYVVRAKRSAVQQFMLDIANRQEQFILDARTYTTAITTTPGLNMSITPEVTGLYTVSVALVAGPAPGYTITAAPVAGGSQAGDGTLALDNLGVKSPTAKWK